MDISVVIPTYNRSRSLTACLNSLARQTLPKDRYEVIVVDDGSSHDTAKVVRRFMKGLQLIYLRQPHQGHSTARNRGFRQARSPIIASTDDDCILPPTWLTDILHLFAANPKVAAVGGSFVNGNSDALSRASFLLDFSSWLPTEPRRLLKDIPTANIAYRREVVSARAFEDDKRSIGYRDSLFNYRLYCIGHKILFEPSLTVEHRRVSPLSAEEYYGLQKRRGKGFYHGGYRMHGTAGRLLRMAPVLNLLCPRLVLVLFRCFRSRKQLGVFLRHLPVIAQGELARSKAIVECWRIESATCNRNK